MTFLEAHKIVRSFTGGEELRFLLAMSGTATQLELFLRAAAAKRGRAATVRTLPFNTLAQYLRGEPDTGEAEVFLLLPWDFVPESDWRSGLPSRSVDGAELRERAGATSLLLQRRVGAHLLYLPAPLPPILRTVSETDSLAHWLSSLVCSLGAQLLPSEAFSLGGYFASGCPIAGAWLDATAQAVVEQAISSDEQSCKVLVTDLDNVMWSGVIEEDGIEGISFLAEGTGYRHFLYQSFLSKLKRQGVLLAVVSRNNPEVAKAPFRSGRMALNEEDFVSVVCSYHAKSAQIRELAQALNLGIDSFVFVDDNPVELAEVAAQLPQVHCVPFPTQDDELPELFRRLVHLFRKPLATTEDQERTELYRRRLEGMPPSELKGADLTSFLRDLGMELKVHDRTCGERTRSLQLINKTNQFNLNGHRLREEEMAAVLSGGGRLYSATLSDRHGTHGEILACLILPDGVIVSFVMSCRVLQRRVEHAFLTWLARRPSPPHSLDFVPTQRNEPFREFLKDPAFTLGRDNLVRFDAAIFSQRHAADLNLFRVRDPGEG